MHAIRSLIVLIAFRATGVSANFRKFAGVGFGIPSLRAPIVNTDGNAKVFLPSPCVPAALISPTVNPSVVVMSGAGAASAVEPPISPPKISFNFSPIPISAPYS
jgi:hypothetical protein